MTEQMTSVKIPTRLLPRLDGLKTHRNDAYFDVIERLLNEAEKKAK